MERSVSDTSSTTAMPFRRLGPSGLQVSLLSFGSWVTFKDQLDVGLGGLKSLGVTVVGRVRRSCERTRAMSSTTE
jgi:aryl-alcohol dehydrogenase-like predicted oxidoreductase